MPAKIVLFGATGYTGRLWPKRWSRAASGRCSRDAAPHGSRSWQRARWGARDGGRRGRRPGLGPRAARRRRRDASPPSGRSPASATRRPRRRSNAGARYLDSTGEPAFIRRVFEPFGPRAERRGGRLVTAFGYDWVPGNLAAALALRDAGEAATAVDVGYFTTGGGLGGMSGGTRASLAGAIVEPAFAWRDGIRTERGAARVRSFELRGKTPRGDLGRLVRALRAAAGCTRPARGQRLPRAGSPAPRGRCRHSPRSTAGRPDTRGEDGHRGAHRVASSRARPAAPTPPRGPASGSAIVAIAYAGGHELASVELRGGNGYEFTGRILAWGASRALAEGMRASGAIGPVEAFGLDPLEEGCAEAGIARV